MQMFTTGRECPTYNHMFFKTKRIHNFIYIILFNKYEFIHTHYTKLKALFWPLLQPVSPPEKYKKDECDE